ncbi:MULTISPECIES: hypothetical protein [Streptomycetaceae]|uniref:Regulatory protein n=1 Tax=Streptantibioticus cattleyicolor (strain ATCC 35852 / DSM 46488 / JCM 4925 / NBRC 14057 / NRRL 8057) TaxID=1003195 RepID=F8K2V8_STREN|nr:MULTISPECIES: hypothetical protein [Streptomycetaceae]AEW95650.1 regulatory protein [Streptantibioticus cattleyicolor NRRL 8057 = DSM 46488]MYS60195.1 hypothetical protein [Streptomyces sp. SID5468]CCB75984.1 putative regulatory protein [Streptantibioticus cattleyicolor NRRL 8057 = DSM 46488]
MGRRPRTPNTALAALMQSGGIGNAQLARRVNATGRELGITLHYDKTSVSHWLSGSVPRPEARPAVAEAISRLLGRPVTCAEIGWTDEPVAAEVRDVVAGVIDLSRADMDPSRRGVLRAGMYAAALVVPRFEDMAGRMDAARAGRTVHIGHSDVETVRTMTEKVADILDQVGAGHARPMAAAFLVNTAGPFLRASGTDKVTRQMRAAVADFVYLTGWMAMYENQQGLGQHYYLRALELAGAAEDHVTYCRTLRGMSLQASHLGHGPKALQLADAAAEAAPAAGPRLVAFLRGQQAAAAAMTGNRHTATARLREAETALSRADDRRDAVGGYDTAAFHFHEAHVRWHLGDQAGSITALRRSNAARSPLERQGRLHCLGVIAERQFRMGHIEAACTTWAAFLDEHVTLSSARGDEHLKTMLKALPAHRDVAGVTELEERARHVATLKTA